MDESERSEVTIVGGGLVGSLLAIYLVRRGLRVSVYERLPDGRDLADRPGRSINLVLTRRGLDALAAVGLERDTLRLTVPVLGRMVHAVDGRLSYQPYGRDESECNHAISRHGLNRFLISRAEALGVRFHFEHALSRADLDAGVLTFEQPAGGTSEVRAPLVLGADGAGSTLRAALMRRPGHAESIEKLDHGYKELVIPASSGTRLDGRALHIWPRGEIMLMALPNLDGSFTATLYLPERGTSSFAELRTGESARQLFRELFPDALELVPTLERDWVSNPMGSLGTVRCGPWSAGDRLLLLGDAAHAIVPFFGQGANCGFEDCAVLAGLLDRHGHESWDRVFAAFFAARKPNTDAIADMALENFVEMRDRVGDPRFLLQKAVEHRLEQQLPREYRSRYSMVMYSGIPYRVAREAGEVQREILEELCAGIGTAEAADLERARQLIRTRLQPLLARRGVTLDY